MDVRGGNTPQRRITQYTRPPAVHTLAMTENIIAKNLSQSIRFGVRQSLSSSFL